MNNKINIAIDGPASSGKSTTAKLLANKLSYRYLDTGATYRAATYLWILNDKIDISEFQKVFEKSNIEIKFDGLKQLTFLNGIDVSLEIRNQEVTANVSFISSLEFVRTSLVNLQREFAKSKSVIVDGRDIGTVVLPDAELKLYLFASIEERAKRRHLEYQKMGQQIDFDTLKNEIANRDKLDSEREISPLRKAEDAVEIDTTGLTIGDQVNRIYKLALKKINEHN